MASKLSPRETEIILKIAEGIRTSDIATQLGIGEETVKYHRKEIYRKLQAKNAANAVYKWTKE